MAIENGIHLPLISIAVKVDHVKRSKQSPVVGIVLSVIRRAGARRKHGGMLRRLRRAHKLGGNWRMRP